MLPRRFKIDWFLLRRTNRELVDATFDVARAAGDSQAGGAAARLVAERFGNECLRLSRRFHHPPSRPSEFDHENGITAFCEWLSAWQWAVLEVFYCAGAPAIGAVHSVAFGAYDWHQAGALAVLCRWWLDGMPAKETIDLVGNRLADMRWETIGRLADYLELSSLTDSRMKRVIELLDHVPDEARREFNSN